jgi:predicted transglutaminase-like cysteine proteinase
MRVVQISFVIGMFAVLFATNARAQIVDLNNPYECVQGCGFSLGDRLATPVLAPIAFVRFCTQHPADCKVSHMEVDGKPVILTRARLVDLLEVNRGVNESIKPQANIKSVLTDEWRLAPSLGDCNDYAVTKRHELLARGWPSRSLLLAEVLLASGEHHLVLLVRTREDDLVLDNLSWKIRPASQSRYRWVRAQQVENPMYWSTLQ